MPSQPANRLRLLVADTDPAFADAVTDAIEAVDRAVTAESVTASDELIERARRNQEDLGGIVVGDGLGEPVDVIDRLTEATGLPVVLLTGATDDGEFIAAAVAAGVADYFPRTTTVAQYELVVETIASRAGGTGPPATAPERGRRALLFENTPDPIMAVEFEDGDPYVTEVNPAFEDAFGIDPGTVRDRPIPEVIVPEGEREGYERIRKRALAGELVDTEVRRRTARGVRDFLLRVLPFERDGRRRAYVWYTDITERKRRERAIGTLQEATERMQDAESAESVAETAVGAAAEALGLPVTACWFHDSEEGRLDPVAATDAVYDRDLLSPLSAARYEYEVFRDGEVTTYTPHEENPDNPLETAILLPLGDHGLVAAGRPDRTEYDEVTLDVARALAEHTTTALDRIERAQDLRESERRFRLIAEHIDEIIYLASGDFSEILYINPAYEEIYGRPVEELYEHPTSFVEAAHPEDREAYEDDIRRLIEDVESGDPENAYEGEYRLQRGNETRWVTVSRFPVENEDGTVDRIVGRVRDVTERKRREREYEGIFDSVNDTIAVYHPDTAEILDVNERYHEVWGYDDLDTIRELGIEGLSATEEGFTGERGRELVREVAEAGEAKTVEWLGVTKDGERRWTEAKLTAAEISGEQRVLSIQRDITERKRREREYEQIFNEVTDAISVHDPETGEIIEVNETLCEILGYDRDEILERGLAGVSVTEEGYTADRGFEIVQRVMESGDPETFEWKVETASGERRWMEVNATPAVINGEERYLAIDRDITERKEREQRLEVFNRVLRHNLRNHLDVIKSHAESLIDETDSDHARRVVASADRLAAMGSRAREIDRIMSRELIASEVDLPETIRDELDSFDPVDRGVSVTLDVPETAPLVTDREVLGVVIENVLDNAIRYAESTVEASIEDTPEGYAITVADDGPGISSAELAPVDAGTETDLQHGRGLGLWQLKWGVEKLNGSLSFESDPGTTVRITVPDLGGTDE